MEQNLQHQQMQRKKTMGPKGYDEENQFGANLED